MNLFEQQSTLQSITISKACVPIVDLLATSIGVCLFYLNKYLNLFTDLLVAYVIILISFCLVYFRPRAGPHTRNHNRQEKGIERAYPVGPHRTNNLEQCCQASYEECCPTGWFA